MAQILITGVAGFLGSHLADFYLAQGDTVVGVDNLLTGRKENLSNAQQNPNFTFVEHDISEPFPSEILDTKFDLLLNFACPASPPWYQKYALETLLVSSVGVKNMVDLAIKNNARLIHASTSEVYGDPLIHPQPESYWGNANSYGPRAMYDEGKRFAEALIWTAQHNHHLNAGLVRIFNTYGPRMDPQDGRVVSNLIVQALKNEPLTIHGDGNQTRSFCFVSDLIDGITKLAASNEQAPVNIGNPNEFTINDLSKKIIDLTGSTSEITYIARPTDDPTQRQPDIARAKEILNWQPKVELEEGLKKTIEYFKG